MKALRDLIDAIRELAAAVRELTAAVKGSIKPQGGGGGPGEED